MAALASDLTTVEVFQVSGVPKKPSLKVIFSSLFLAQWPNVLIIYLYHQRRLGKDWEITDGLDKIIHTLKMLQI